jgi:hypothetical protein
MLRTGLVLIKRKCFIEMHTGRDMMNPAKMLHTVRESATRTLARSSEEVQAISIMPYNVV